MSRFQSTLSVRRATTLDMQARLVIHISIHALRKESDESAENMRRMVSHFNPRSP